MSSQAMAPSVPAGEKGNPAFRPSLTSLEQIAKSTGVVGALLYGIGVWVSNDYLLQFGVSDFGSLHIKNVITGSWTLLICFGSAMPGLAANFSFGKFKDGNIWERTFWVALWISVGVGIGFLGVQCVLIILTWSRPSDLALSSESQVLSLMATASLPVLMFGPLVRKGSQMYNACFVIRVPLACFAFLSISATLAHSVYAKLPPAVGGGEPVYAKLFLDEKAAAVWKKDGLPYDGDESQTALVDIVHQTDNELYIAVDPYPGLDLTQTIILDRKSVIGIAIVDRRIEELRKHSVQQQQLKNEALPTPLPSK